MKPIEIVDFLRLEQPQLLGKMPDKKAAGLIRAALALVSRRIDALEEGFLQVAGLGVFRVRRVAREKDGQKVMVRQVILRKGMPRQAAGSRTSSSMKNTRRASVGRTDSISLAQAAGT